MQRTVEYDSNPNGFLTGGEGDLATHIPGAVTYVKTGGTSNTGWVPSDPSQGVFLTEETVGGGFITSEDAQILIDASLPSVVVKATTPYSVLAADDRTIFTNEGATAQIVFNLPSAAVSLSYTFIVQDADGIQVVAAAGDTIRVASSVSASAGNIVSTAIGSVLTLVALNATEWVATTSIGIWTIT